MHYNKFDRYTKITLCYINSTYCITQPIFKYSNVLFEMMPKYMMNILMTMMNS